MSEGPETPTPPTTTQVAYVELREKQREVAQRLASLRAELRAIETAQEALEPHAKGDLIRLEFTKNHTVFLGATCYHFAARHPELGVDACKLLNHLGDELVQATHDQNADFARRCHRLVYGESAGEDVDQPPASHPYAANRPPPKLPKRSRPYLRFSDEQIEAALARSTVGCSYDYVGEDHANLHLSRTALLEMFRRPRYTKIVFAAIMQRMDGQGRFWNLFRGHPSDRGEDDGPIRSRPYERFSDEELRAGLKRLGLSPGQVKFSYGRLTVNLRRPAVLHLYRARAGDPGIAYLLKVCDEHETAKKSRP